MDPEQVPRRKRGIKKSESIALGILRGAINGVSSSNAASKSRIISFAPQFRHGVETVLKAKTKAFGGSRFGISESIKLS